MLKMKIDPAMCMKTKARMTNCPAKNTLFTRKYGNCSMDDKNPAGFLPEDGRIVR
jgi:hypothetical protein